MTIDQEIETAFRALGQSLANPARFSNGTLWDSNSQYGHCLMGGFKSEIEAREYTFSYYRVRLGLIRQDGSYRGTPQEALDWKR